MWRVGQDAALRMTLGALVFLDRPPDAAALHDRLVYAVGRAPRLSQRPEDAPGRLRLRWSNDEDPSVDAHLRRLSVAAPGTQRQVLDLVALLEAVPFDPSRSPWDVTLIEGMAGDGAALYLRAHHVLTDGLAGLRLLGLLLDESTWPRVASPEQRSQAQTTPAGHNGEAADRPLGTFTITIDTPALVRRFVHGMLAARDFAPVETAVYGVQRALDVANSVSRQMMVTGGPLAPRPAGRSLLSHFELFSIDGARDAALALGGSRNDLLVAASAAGLGRYYERLGTPTAELRLATPAGQGHPDELGGNWFAPARVEVPSMVGRPGPQFGVVAERLSQARREPALRVASTVAAALGRVPPQVLLPALRSQAESVDFAATVLPGLRLERHICGSSIEAVYPLGPRLGCPMNITAFGNAGRLDIGLALDPSAFPDAEMVVECLREAFARYLGAAGHTPSPG